MSRILACLAAAAIVAAPAAAVGYGFSAEYTGTPIPTIGTVNVTMNPEIVKETRLLTRQSPGYEMYIAPSDAEDLIEELREELESELARTGAFAPHVGGPVGTLNVIIEQATPSNPAHTENGRNQGLDFRSAGRGGATLVAQLLSPNGEPVADFTYRWEESAFDLETAPRIGWWGAERAFDRFASRLARELSSNGGAS